MNLVSVDVLIAVSQFKMLFTVVLSESKCYSTNRANVIAVHLSMYIRSFRTATETVII